MNQFITIRRKDSFLGNGIRFPMMRVGNDFQASFGEDKVLSSVPYILLTNADGPDGQGEQPWDTEFGSQLRRIKFSTLSGEELRAFVENFVIEALVRNEPRIIVQGVEVEKVSDKKGNRVEVLLSLGIIDRDVDASDVRLQTGVDLVLALPY